MQSVAKGVDDFFSIRGQPGSPATKRQAVGASKENQDSSESVISKGHADWLKEAVGGAISHLGRAVDERVAKVENQVEELDQRIVLLEKNTKKTRTDEVAVEAQKATAQIEGLKGDLKAVKDELTAVKTGKGPSSPAPGTCGGQDLTPVPWNLRTQARMGELGWDTPGPELVQRAKKALTDAGVSEGDWQNMRPVVHARTQKGSAVELSFAEPSGLRTASNALKDKSFVLEGREKPVWLGPKKEQAELRPGRLTRRCFEHVQKVLEAKQSTHSVKKRMDAKWVEINDHVAAYVLNGRIEWTAHAAAILSDEERQVAKAFAEA